MQISELPPLRAAICVLAVVLLAGCSGIPTADTLSDLEPGAIGILPTEPVAGEDFEVEFTFSNDGVATNSAGFHIRLRIYNGSGALVGVHDDIRFDSTLEEDQAAQVAWDIEGLPAGDYEAVVRLDVDDEVNEIDDDDNEGIQAFTVVADDSKPTADLPSGDG